MMIPMLEAKKATRCDIVAAPSGVGVLAVGSDARICPCKRLSPLESHQHRIPQVGQESPGRREYGPNSAFLRALPGYVWGFGVCTVRTACVLVVVAWVRGTVGKATS